MTNKRLFFESCGWFKSDFPCSIALCFSRIPVNPVIILRQGRKPIRRTFWAISGDSVFPGGFLSVRFIEKISMRKSVCRRTENII